MTFWLKALGWPDPNQYAGVVFNQAALRIDFPTGAGQPGLEIGDIAIVFGIGITNVLYVARVTRAAYQATPAELVAEPWRADFIWSVDAENLFPNFGVNWQQYHLNPFQLVQDFHHILPNNPVTMAGNQALGAINQGNDRIRLRPEFALFIIGHIAALN